MLSTSAATLEVGNYDVTYSGAVQAKKLANGEAVLVFDNAEAVGSFSVPAGLNARVRILAVGGGGAGGAMSMDLDRGAAGGGGAGGVVDYEAILDGGTYDVTVGAGGRRVQTIVQSWIGDDGEFSYITKEEEIIVAAKGGGGGGSVKVNGRGTEGGSGGGGSWYQKFLGAGSGTDGQGWSGGMPEDMNYGGGGGGGATTSAGRGGVAGQAGAGRASDITGTSVVYAKGGRGGRRGDDSYEPADGVNYGDGGDGAVNGYGGAGADGVVIVRFEKVFEYTVVEIPDYSTSCFWENGATVSALDAYALTNAVNGTLRDAISYMTGITSTNCTQVMVNGTNTLMGCGRHQFVIYLNDEYIWKTVDENNKVVYTTDPLIGVWRVKEPGTIGEAAVDVKKTVSWTDGGNATISIDIHAVPEEKMRDPRVLVLGALCGAHGLTSEVVNSMLNAITEVGSVDYYYYNKVNSSDSAPQPYFSGSLAKGEKHTGTVYGLNANGSNARAAVENCEGNHGVLYGFYYKLGQLMDSGALDEYDYIVFSFDRTQVATYFPKTAHAKESQIAAKLKKFYDNNSVIWLVDNKPPNNDSLGVTQTPWFPSPMCYVEGSSFNYWSLLGQYQYSWGGDTTSPYGWTAYKALMGIFDPAKYATLNKTTYQNNTAVNAHDRSKMTKAGIEAFAGTAIENQVVYNNAKNVSDMIEQVVQAKGSTISFNDAVCVKEGLTVTDVAGVWLTNGQDDWTRLSDDQYDITDEGVSVHITNVWEEAWVKVDIFVTDNGRFRSSVNATYNMKTGLWEKDPNNGPVRVELTPDGSPALLDEDTAATAVAWSFKAYKITGGIVHGEGEFVINGFITNEVSVCEGYSPEVVFRGAAGWVLDYLEVDGLEIKDITSETYNWFFENIGADHDVRVGFKNVLSPPYPSTGPNEQVYDGTPCQPTITTPPSFVDGYEFDWYPVYSLTPDGEFSATNGLVNAGTTNVYVRICIQQPGYENGVILDSWTGVNTVTVNPRPITVTFDDYVQTSAGTRKTSGFSYSITDGNLVYGDSLDYNAGQVSGQPTQPNDNQVGTITKKGDMHVTTPDFGGSNYAITVVPGKYYYPNLQIQADAPDVTEVYSGDAYSTEAAVSYPVNAATRTGKEDSGKKGDVVSRGNFGTKYASNNYRIPRGWTSYYYHVTSNEQATVYTTVNTELVKEYSTNGVDYTTTPPTFIDVGDHTVYYRVSFTSNEVRRTVIERYLTGNTSKNGTSGISEIDGTRTTVDAGTETVPFSYTTETGTATIKVLPRPVVIRAHSASKKFDDTPLTEAGYTTEAPTETTGFISGEGFANDPMTAESTILYPGTMPNVIDQPATKATFHGRSIDNYTFTFHPGTLTITPDPLSASALDIVTTYNGSGTNLTSVAVKGSDDKTLDPSRYTIKYARNPWEEYTDDLSKLAVTNAGEYAVWYIVDGGPGRGVVTNYMMITVNPIEIVLQAADDSKTWDGDPLTNVTFQVVEGAFIGNEGISAVTMTAGSTITDPGTTGNVIDLGAATNWTFTGGLDATKLTQNYRITVLPGELKVTEQGKALWIIDHDDPGDGYVYLAFEPELKNEENIVDWVKRFDEKNHIRVKYGKDRASADACTPLEAHLADDSNHAPAARKVWITVAIADIEDFKNVGFWRIFIDGDAIQLSGTEETQVSSGPKPKILKTDSVAESPEAVAEQTEEGIFRPNAEIINHDGALSANTFGILKIETQTTNTLVAVPWTWYSKLQKDARNIPIRKFVKPTNLTEGDIVYAYVDDWKYMAWALDDGDWRPLLSVKISDVQQKLGGGTQVLTGDNDEMPLEQQASIPRGNGIWLLRQKPLDDQGRPIPFWIYGQSVTNEVVTEIAPMSATNAVKNTVGMSTIVGNPYAQPVSINDLVFEGTIEPGLEGDNIVIPNDTAYPLRLWYNASVGKWCYSTTIQKVFGKRTVLQAQTVYDYTVPAGLAFWYVRRANGTLKIKWPHAEVAK